MSGFGFGNAGFVGSLAANAALPVQNNPVVPDGTFIGPITFSESDANLYAINSSPPQSLITSTPWHADINSGYVDGKGAYSIQNGDGYMFNMYGSGFSLGGLANSYGGNFSVEVDGTVVGNGNCASGSLTQKTYYLVKDMVVGLHTVKVRKLDGQVLYADTFSVFA